MLTTIETLRPPVFQASLKLQETDAPQYRHPFELVQSVVECFKRDARYLGLEPAHVEGWNNGPTFYLETWRAK